jgi:AbrB family looped-hinge helix DNA binding protein
MQTAIATITSKGQVTIPKEVRQALDVTANDQLIFFIEGDKTTLAPLKRRSLASFRGAFRSGQAYPGAEALREQTGRQMGAEKLAEVEQAQGPA